MADKKNTKQEVRKVNPIPEWMGRQFDLVNRKVSSWPPAEQEWIDGFGPADLTASIINVSPYTNLSETIGGNFYCEPEKVYYYPNVGGMDVLGNSFIKLDIETDQPTIIFIEYSNDNTNWVEMDQVRHSQIKLDDYTNKLYILYLTSFEVSFCRYFRIWLRSEAKSTPRITIIKE